MFQMAKNSKLGVRNMRFIPAIAALLCLSQSALANDWVEIKDVKVEVNSVALPAVIYDPSLTIDEINSQISSRDKQSHLYVEVELPRDKLTLKKIVDRAAVFVHDGKSYAAQVTAAFVSPSKSGSQGGGRLVRLAVRVDNKKLEDQWALHHGDGGKLFVLR